ncbi:MAG: ATP-binding protein [Patescibacteria group bacterium]
MLYTRDLFKRLESELDSKEVMIITGMRRVGKTTALNYLYGLVHSENKAIFDFENPLHRKTFEEKDYDSIWNNLKQFNITNDAKAYIFIDEVQNLPEISRVVKYLYDHWNVKFILTGSSSYYLKNLFPESLAGRKLIFEMFPLNFGEFLIFQQIKRDKIGSFNEMSLQKNKISYQKLIHYYKEFIEFGGFPSVVLEKNIERKKILLSEIFTSYFENDVRNLADFKEMSKLRDLILLLSSRIASRIEINKLASELSTSRETIYNYLSFLDHTYFISLLPKYSKSIDRQAAGSKKLFLCDSGIANVLGKVSEGQLLEQSVFQNLRSRHNLTFYSKSGINEIDFVADGEMGLEVKVSASRQDIATLKRRAAPTKLKDYFVISYQFSDFPKVIPVVYL